MTPYQERLQARLLRRGEDRAWNENRAQCALRAIRLYEDRTGIPAFTAHLAVSEDSIYRANLRLLHDVSRIYDVLPG